MRTYSIHNFGCRATQADGSALASALEARGLTPESDAPDLVILNTCTVTAAADADVHKMVHRVRRENPAGRILVTGCYAQRAPEELAKLAGVDWVVGNSHKTQIPEIVLAPTYHGQITVGEVSAPQDFFSLPILDPSGERSRPNLKIQDGCNNRCSFCIIPSVRGRSRSAQPEWVIEQVSRLSRDYREVVLTGINLGRWGRDLATGRQFARLLRDILARTSISRLRLSSIEPMDFSDDLLALMAESPRIARHVHAPLQSGSDTVLRRMYRKYRPRHYEDRIRRAHALMPDAAIGADVMVGFPGETEAEFEESRQFIASLPFTYLHVFTYSERPGTRAADSAAPVPMEVRKERNRILRELSAAKNLAFRQSLVGKTLSVVTLAGDKALSSNYVPVKLGHHRPANQLVDIRVDALADPGVREAVLLPVLA
ncbi:MAG: tRNA (N(6)-L-threonylcarbamoyladenosine(37)-C(2))-methylthiotransferase MtaB [Bryobacteraceae bacterium]|nr:tRNA (N(6)-L-threonylcarbamoyladenosine(37)-C(2))-methylthiotransferase MtaB [Bryobacteraceae bacterium]